MKKLILLFAALLLIPTSASCWWLISRQEVAAEEPAGYTVSYVAASECGGDSGIATCSPPTGTTTGDRMFAFCSDDFDGQAVELSGWTDITYVEASSTRQTLLYRDYDSGDTTYAFTLEAGSTFDDFGCSVITLRKTGGTWDITEYTSNGVVNTTPIPFGTTLDVTADSVLLAGWGCGDVVTSHTSPISDMTVASSSTDVATEIQSTTPALETYYQEYSVADSAVTKSKVTDPGRDSSIIGIAVGAN